MLLTQIPRVLVFENRPSLGLSVREVVTRLGLSVVGPASSLLEAMRLLRFHEVDIAIVDFSMGFHEDSYPIAAVLRQRGIPFAFSGDRETYPDFAEIPVIIKSVQLEEARVVVADLLSNSKKFAEFHSCQQ